MIRDTIDGGGSDDLGPESMIEAADQMAEAASRGSVADPGPRIVRPVKEGDGEVDSEAMIEALLEGEEEEK